MEADPFWILIALGAYALACLICAVDVATGGHERRAARRAEHEAWEQQRARSVRRPLLVPHDLGERR